MDSHPLLPALLLHHVPGLGPNRIKLALQQFRCFKTLLTQNDQFWLKGIRIGQKGWSAIREWQNQGRNSTLYQRAQEGLNWLNESDNNHIFSLACSDYPAQLKNIFDPPLILYIKGNAALLSKQQIAVVGARQATRSGLDTAFQYSKVLKIGRAHV